MNRGGHTWGMREVTLRQEKASLMSLSGTPGHWRRGVLSPAQSLSLGLFFIPSAVEEAGGGEGSLSKNRKSSLPETP